jgi:hypothetical protein
MKVRDIMIKRVRRHATPASVIAVLALVFAMSGGAYAAKKYLISSTKQISPSVLKALKGTNGKSGTTGPAGPVGATGSAGPSGTTGSAGPTGAAGTGKEGAPGKDGKEGKEGKEGKTGFTKTLPSGSTETGVWSAHFEGVTEGTSMAAVSFTIPLAEALGETAKHYVTAEQQTNKTGPAACPGNAEEPAATAGNFCMYEGEALKPSGTLGVTIIAPPSSLGNPEGVGTAGAVAFVRYEEGEATEPAEIDGSWAVTAP